MINSNIKNVKQTLPMEEIVRSLYFDDFKVGQQFVSKSRTLTEADIVNFAGLSWDHNQLHTDAEYAGRTQYGKRIAHGLLGVVAHAGLTYQLTEDSILALLQLDWKFHLPIYIDDTIRVEQTVKELRESSRGDRGILTFKKRSQKSGR